MIFDENKDMEGTKQLTTSLTDQDDHINQQQPQNKKLFEEQVKIDQFPLLVEAANKNKNELLLQKNNLDERNSNSEIENNTLKTYPSSSLELDSENENNLTFFTNNTNNQNNEKNENNENNENNKNNENNENNENDENNENNDFNNFLRAQFMDTKPENETKRTELFGPIIEPEIYSDQKQESKENIDKEININTNTNMNINTSSDSEEQSDPKLQNGFEIQSSDNQEKEQNILQKENQENKNIFEPETKIDPIENKTDSLPLIESDSETETNPKIIKNNTEEIIEPKQDKQENKPKTENDKESKQELTKEAETIIETGNIKEDDQKNTNNNSKKDKGSFNLPKEFLQKYDLQFDILKDMGFTDTITIFNLLEKHKGLLPNVLNELVNN